MMDLVSVRLDPGELDELRAVLTAEKLPIVDLGEPGRVFFRFDNSGGLVGFGGIEGDGPDRLLRSLVVVSGRRNARLGCAMLPLLEREARQLDTERLHLLTTTAAPFFRANGYADANRGSAPQTIAGSREFTALCPASAAYLVKDL